MSSKRSRKDKASSSSSTIAYDKRIFVSEDAFLAHQAAIDKKKPWVPERGFDLYMYAPYDRMMDTIARRKWQLLCSQPNPAVKAVVREFYANATARNDFKAVVRGKTVSYSAVTINAYYALENIEHDDYHLFESNWQPTEILRYISSPAGRWKTTEQPLSHKLPTHFLPAEQKAWHQFVGAKILPTKHYGTIDQAYGNLLRSIMTQETINVGRIIQNSIVKSKNNTQLGFYHPCLITELCRQAGVPILDKEEKYNLLHIIDRKIMMRFEKCPALRAALAAPGRPSRNEASSSRPPVPEPNAPVDLSTRTYSNNNERFLAIESKLYHARMDIRAYHAEMTEHHRRVETRMWEYVAYQDMFQRMQLMHLRSNTAHLPPAPEWLPPYPPLVPTPPTYPPEENYTEKADAANNEDDNDSDNVTTDNDDTDMNED